MTTWQPILLYSFLELMETTVMSLAEQQYPGWGCPQYSMVVRYYSFCYSALTGSPVSLSSGKSLATPGIPGVSRRQTLDKFFQRSHRNGRGATQGR